MFQSGTCEEDFDVLDHDSTDSGWSPLSALMVAAMLQLFVVAMVANNGSKRLAPGQWMPIGIAVAGMVCAAVMLAR